MMVFLLIVELSLFSMYIGVFCVAFIVILLDDIDTFLLFTSIAVALFFAFTVIFVLEMFVFINAIIFPFYTVFVVFIVISPLFIVRDPSVYVAVDILILSSEFISGAFNVKLIEEIVADAFSDIWIACA